MEYVEKYKRQGIKLFPANKDKSPQTQRGLYDATDDMEAHKAQYQKPDTLKGMPTGNINKIVVADIDVNKPMEDEHGKKILDSNGQEIIDPRTVEEILEALKEYGDIPDTFQVETPSGGRHFYYRVPFTKLNSARRFFDKTLPVDIRANGGYVIAADGKKYIVYDDVDGLDVENLYERCATLPEWIENFKKEQPETRNESTAPPIPPEEVREIRSALAFLDSDDRDEWIDTGMILKTLGPVGKGLWDEWSQKSDKYNPKDQEKRWKSLKPRGDIGIASIFYKAKQNGWVTTYETREEPVESIENYREAPALILKYSRPPFPKELLLPDGLVGELIEFINKKSIKDQPVLALGASLAAVGALQGRKIQTEMNIRTNIYCLGVGASGCGKEAARKAIKDVFHAAGCGEIASVEEIASDSSITNNLKKHPAQIYLLDEIGRFLKTTTQASKNPHLFNIITTLLKLYSSSNSVFYGKIYADVEKQVKIQNPNLCIYGTTVPDHLYKGLVQENITDGFLSRMLLFESESPDPPKKPRRNLTGNPPVELLEKVSGIYRKVPRHIPQGNIDNQANVYPDTVDITDDAIDLLEGYDDYIRNLRAKLVKENRIDSIYNRTTQIAEQIALIIAGGVDIEYPKITKKEMDFAIKLTQYLADNMLYIAENFIADNEYHHAVKNVLQIIRTSGKISMSKLTRKTQEYQSRLRLDILTTLKDSEQIKEFTEGTGSNKRRFFVPS